ncbi:MAG: hypothetical protein CM1200mP10_32340 [Candidatus Neomarinimicrobiota bacterium]|nr:MAG: hypothetical protein CM1200mP10_32340 [Candidatus Neomarinimicrobiota bacterium]
MHFALESPLISIYMENSASANGRNTVLAKPSEITPYTAYKFGRYVWMLIASWCIKYRSWTGITAGEH